MLKKYIVLNYWMTKQNIKETWSILNTIINKQRQQNESCYLEWFGNIMVGILLTTIIYSKWFLYLLCKY